MTIAMTKMIIIMFLGSAAVFAYSGDLIKNPNTQHIDSTTTTKNLRGVAPAIDGNVTIKVITGNVGLRHLLESDRVSERGEHPRRLGLTPSRKNIEVYCQNTTSNCGRHGVCRVSGSSGVCHCDGGYYSLDKNEPCAEKGKSQTLYAVLSYMFGWTGGPAFALGWTVFGVVSLLSCCCGTCFYGQTSNPGFSEGKQMLLGCIGILMLLTAFGLWIYGMVMISTDNCVSSNGVPCEMW